MFTGISGAIFLASLYVFHVTWRAAISPLRRVPGPWHSRLTGLVVHIHWGIGNRTEYVHALHQKYGRVVRLSPTEVSFSDLSATKEIFKIGGNFVKSKWYRLLAPKDVQNLFNTNDPKLHAKRHRLLAGPISDSSLRPMEPVIIQKTQYAIQRMKEDTERCGVADVYKWWVCMAGDIVGELSFGRPFGLLDGKDPQLLQDINSISTNHQLNTTFPGILGLLRLSPISLPKFLYTAVRLREFAEESVQQYKKQLLSNPHNPEPRLFTKILQSTTQNDGISDAGVRNEATSYVVAGTHTSAVILTYLVWAVCKHVDIRKKLLAEIESLPCDLTDDDIRKLPYLESVIDETMRLYASTPSGLRRVSPPGGATLAGYYVPAGMTVSTQAYTLHRDPNIFPEPEMFNPSRWDTPTREMKDAFIPFSRGTRSCIGKHLARREIRLAVVHFFRMFPQAEVATEKDGMNDAIMEQRIYLIMAPRGKCCWIKCF